MPPSNEYKSTTSWSAARPEKSRRCSLSRSAAIDGRHVSRNVALSAKLEMNVWTRSSLWLISKADSNGCFSQVRRSLPPPAVLQTEKIPRRDEFLSGSDGCGSTESARSAEASSLTNCRGSIQSRDHCPCVSAQRARSRYRKSAAKHPTGSCCCDSKQRACTCGALLSSEPSRRRKSCSACLLLKAPLVASELVTSQISSICSRVLRSLLSISAGIRTSRVPC
mmetsp:Transcript_6200/g.19400  ORF Transcript_6200/g.19400 Transcript_6200/m.19400 type:complete len:223 (+) Transcript_6200:2100-2768(+)